MAKNRWSYSVFNLTSQRILSGCVCVCVCVWVWVCTCTQILSLRQDAVCVRCWVKPLIEKQATVATCLAVSPSICLEQHEASCERWREGGGARKPTERRFPFISSSLSPPLSLSLFSLFGRQHLRFEKKNKKKKTHPSPSVSRLSVSFFVFHHPRVSAGSYHNTTRSVLWV